MPTWDDPCLAAGGSPFFELNYCFNQPHDKCVSSPVPSSYYSRTLQPLELRVLPAYPTPPTLCDPTSRSDFLFALWLQRTLRQISFDASNTRPNVFWPDPDADQSLGVDLGISPGMDARLRRSHRATPFHRLQISLLYVLLVSSGRWGRKSLVSAQNGCSERGTEAIRVDGTAGVTALRSSVNCTNGGALEAVWAGRVLIDAPIVVAQGTSLSVTGEDALAEAHGSSASSLFEVSGGGALTLTGLKLSGGSAETGGAVSSSLADLTLDNCTFEGNVATDGNAGAVSADGGNLTIVGGVFSNNTATRYGGAVFTNVATLVVEGGTSFDGNKAVQGSALFCGGSVSVEALCSISDAVFTSNTAFKDSKTGDEEFPDLGGGGAASFLLAHVNITDSVFRGNFAHIEAGALYGGGGSFIEVNGCTFEENRSEFYGGAIAASSMALGGGTLITTNAVNRSGGGVSAIGARQLSLLSLLFHCGGPVVSILES